MNVVVSKKSKVFFSALFLVAVMTLFLVYQKYIVDRDYLAFVKSECNPETSACFVSECDFESDPRCEGEKTRYYKVVVKKAYNLPPLDCGRKEEGCRVFYCSAENQKAFEIEDACNNEAE